VEGHSASTGNPSGEKQLSLERAKAIVDALTKRGISAKQFIYIGCGSENPIADNSTTEGKAINRRVEITILE
jgi:outer membrane protein OmpA-like peptidoglycan-associated protein